MLKSFTVGGFLYDSSIQQVLLYQPTDSVSSWALFNGENKKLSHPSRVFQDIIKKYLSIRLDLESICPIYDYFNDEGDKNHHVFYGEVSGKTKKIKPKKGYTVGWFNFKQLYKFQLSQQTRQDVMVGQRVIDAVTRNLEAPLQNASLLHKR